VKNPKTITLNLDAKDSQAIKTYTIRLYFAQPPAISPGTFSVALQGTIVESALDVPRAAGGVGRSLIKEYRGIQVRDQLVIELKPAAKGNATLLSGVEIIDGD
jgi:hypothetical protein